MQSGKPPSFGSKPSGDSGIEMDSTPQVDFNYRGMKVTIFKNGEAHDIGTTIVVSRRQFKHWITFLDHLSRKLNMLAPVHKIFTTDGLPIRQVIHIFHVSFRKILRENISIESEKNETLIKMSRKKNR